MLGVGGIPVILPPPADPAQARHGHNQRDDLHLRSTRAVTGFHIQAVDGTIGHVTGFTVDDQAWKIDEFVVETGHWYAGKEIRIGVSRVSRISHEDSYVFVNLTKTEILRTAEDHVVTTERSRQS